MMPSVLFEARMAELDELVEQCRGELPLSSCVIRDTSNRTNRDWPWWSVEAQQTQESGSEKRRAIASVRLGSTKDGAPGEWEAFWQARVWQGVSEDSFRRQGSWRLAWQEPTPAQLKETITLLLAEAHAAISNGAGSETG